MTEHYYKDWYGMKDAKDRPGILYKKYVNEKGQIYHYYFNPKTNQWSQQITSPEKPISRKPTVIKRREGYEHIREKPRETRKENKERKSKYREEFVKQTKAVVEKRREKISAKPDDDKDKEARKLEAKVKEKWGEKKWKKARKAWMYDKKTNEMRKPPNYKYSYFGLWLLAQKRKYTKFDESFWNMVNDNIERNKNWKRRDPEDFEGENTLKLPAGEKEIWKKETNEKKLIKQFKEKYGNDIYRKARTIWKSRGGSQYDRYPELGKFLWHWERRFRNDKEVNTRNRILREYEEVKEKYLKDKQEAADNSLKERERVRQKTQISLVQYRVNEFKQKIGEQPFKQAVMIQNILKDKYPTMMDVIKDATINWNIQDPNSIKTRLDNICRNSDEIKTILIKEFKEKVGEKFYRQSEQVVRNFKSTYPSIYDFIKTVTNNWAIKDATEIKKNIEINTPRYTFGMISNEAHQKYLDKLLRFRQKVGDDIYDKVGDLQTLMRSNGKNIGWEKLIDRINSKYSNNIEKYIERKTRKENNGIHRKNHCRASRERGSIEQNR